MLSGSCYLPHPDKEETGGEDAHFICAEEQAIGVADGVGGWADVGVNAGLFSRELISNSVRAIQEEHQGSFNPTRVLEKAHSNTKAKGSSTACIVALTDKVFNFPILNFEKKISLVHLCVNLNITNVSCLLNIRCFVFFSYASTLNFSTILPVRYNGNCCLV